MTEAIKQGQYALEYGEIPVGCVFVNTKDSKIIGYGSNKTNATRNGTKHAELVALDDMLINQKLDVSVLRDCDLYVTCEPCIMCAAALAKMGIKKCYFGCYNERFGGCGSILSVHEDSRFADQSTYEIDSGLMKDEVRYFYIDICIYDFIF